MKYHPATHHRRSLRLANYDYTADGAYFITICTHQQECLLGKIISGEMQLNALGQLVDAHWRRLPQHFPNLSLDTFVVMPNHFHGILVFNHSPCRGAALGQNSELGITDLAPNATPSDPDQAYDPGFSSGNDAPEGVALGQGMGENRSDQLPNAAPLQPRLMAGSVGAVILNFKSVTTRSLNRIRRTPGGKIWQRNYYEHIIRNDQSWQFIRDYIHNNPRSWDDDQLHPNQPSK